MLTLSSLIKLPVFTKSGLKIGKIIDIEIDFVSQSVFCYHVLTSGNWLGLWKGRLLISPDQVISITASEMIVMDLVARQKAVIEPGLAN